MNSKASNDAFIPHKLKGSINQIGRLMGLSVFIYSLKASHDAKHSKQIKEIKMLTAKMARELVLKNRKGLDEVMDAINSKLIHACREGKTSVYIHEKDSDNIIKDIKENDLQTLVITQLRGRGFDVRAYPDYSLSIDIF